MSEEKITELESLLRRLIGLGWTSLVSVIVVAFAFGGWVASLELRAQECTRFMTSTNGLLQGLDHFRIETAANRYTASDAVRANTELQALIASHDKRVTRVEDSITGINKSLDRIEGKLGTK